jgi:hypothetical protein
MYDAEIDALQRRIAQLKDVTERPKSDPFYAGAVAETKALNKAIELFHLHNSLHASYAYLLKEHRESS